MKINLNAIPIVHVLQMKGGEKEVATQRFQDELGGILQGRLIPGASIGLHTHEENYEVIYILSGHGVMLCGGERELLGPGDCSYCPQGVSHSLVNNGEEDLVFFAVLPNRPQ